MGQYTIQVAAKLSGIGIHTLRAWEKRYKAVTPIRSKTARRLYSDSDIEKLRLLNDLCTMGNSIGTIAHLSVEELNILLKKMGKEKSPMNATETVVLNQPSLVNVQNSLAGLLMGLEGYKLDVISHEIEKLKLVLSPRAFVFEVLVPILGEVGRRVQDGRVDVAQEHTISAILRFHIGHILFQSMQVKRKKSQVIVLATPEGDFHEFGIMAASLLCSHYGVKYYYFGPNMPAKSFIEASRAVNANILILGTSDISSVFKPGQMDDYLEYLIQGLDKTQNLYVGGDGVFSHNKFKRSRKFNYIPSLKMLDEILKELN